MGMEEDIGTEQEQKNSVADSEPNITALSIVLSAFSIISNAGGIFFENVLIKAICYILAFALIILASYPGYFCKSKKQLGTLNKTINLVCFGITIFAIFYTLSGGVLIKSCGKPITSPTPTPIIEDPSGKIAAGNDFSMLLRSDKTVVTYGPATGIDTSDWANITQIAAYKDHAIGLREDGSVVVTGAQMDEYDISDWSNIQQVAASKNGVIGLTEEGEVEFAGPCHNCMIDCGDWSSVQKIIGAAEIIVAQKMDNTLVAVNEQKDLKKLSMDSGRSIVSGTAVNDRILLVLDNGRIKLIGDGSDLEKNVVNWVDIKQVAAGIGFAVGLKLDGTAIPTGAPVDNTLDVSGWQNVAAICAGKEHVLGLCEDGTVLTAGNVSNGLGEIANENYWVEQN